MAKGSSGFSKARYEASLQWLALTPENPLAPLLPIIDAHHHFISGKQSDFIDHGEFRLPEISPQADNLFGWSDAFGTPPWQVYELDALLRDYTGNNVKATVHIDAEYYEPKEVEGISRHLQPVQETRNCMALTKECALKGLPLVCHGFVGHADLSLAPHVFEEVLDAHMDASEGRLKGIRHSIASDPKGECSGATHAQWRQEDEDNVFRNLRALGSRGLVFECWMYHPNIKLFVKLAKQAPLTTFVMNHIGMPIGVGSYADKKDEVMRQWKADVATAASLDNIVCKVGGYTQHACGLNYVKRNRPPDSEELAHALEVWYCHVFTVFGPDRCIFESNFPMDRVSGSFTVLHNAHKRIVKKHGWNHREQAAFFAGTAKRVYQLELELGETLELPPPLVWKVAGGADKGGILVRQGHSLKSAEESTRLSTGATVTEVALVGDRLHYELVEGTGPQSGWVSVRVMGKVLVEKHMEIPC